MTPFGNNQNLDFSFTKNDLKIVFPKYYVGVNWDVYVYTYVSIFIDLYVFVNGHE